MSLRGLGWSPKALCRSINTKAGKQLEGRKACGSGAWLGFIGSLAAPPAWAGGAVCIKGSDKLAKQV